MRFLENLVFLVSQWSRKSNEKCLLLKQNIHAKSHIRIELNAVITSLDYSVTDVHSHARVLRIRSPDRKKESEKKGKKKVKITCRWIESTEKRAHNETAHFLLLRFCSLIAFWTNGKFAINCVLRWECYLCSQWTVKHKEWQRNFNRMNISNRTTILSI